MKQARKLTRKVKTAIYEHWCDDNLSRPAFLAYWQITNEQLNSIIQAAERAAQRDGAA